MSLEKKDFVEIEFTGRVQDGEIFDSNIAEDLKKVNSEQKAEPFALCLGEGMFMPAVEEFLIGKSEEPATYDIDLTPEKAFGKRNPSLIQRIPLNVFRQQNVNPLPGTIFDFDGRIGKILASSGGRVIVDFNNPVAGKDVTYTVRVLKKITDINEKVKALIRFLFHADLKFEIKDKKLVIESPKQLVEFIKIFKDKFKEILDLDIEIKEIEEKKSEEEIKSQ